MQRVKNVDIEDSEAHTGDVSSMDEHTASTNATLIRSVQNALHLIETLVALGGAANTKELSHASGLPLARTYHLLRTLLHEGYLGKNHDGQFFLTSAWDTIGHGEPFAEMMAKARPLLRDLRDHSLSQVYLAGYVDGEMEVIEYVAAPGQEAMDLWVDFNESAHATAMGKAILRTLPRDARDDYLSRHPLESLTPQTITSVEELTHQLNTPSLLSVDLQEYSPGVHCLAAPVSTATFTGAVGLLRRIDQPGTEFTQSDIATLTAAAGRVSRVLHLAAS